LFYAGIMYVLQLARGQKSQILARSLGKLSRFRRWRVRPETDYFFDGNIVP